VAGERNYLFDGLRGIAAGLVMGMHATPSDAAIWVPGGNLAVDFFFIISGFVISRAYEDRLRAGMSLSAFAGLRIARLYPVYAIGLVLGIVALLRDHMAFPLRATGSAIVAASGFNALMLPAPFGFEALFPTNFVAWSLFAELVVNLAFGAVLFRLPAHWLLVGVGVGGAAIVDHAVRYGSIEGGWTMGTVWIGLARAMFSFTLGMLIARRRPKTALRTSPIAYLIPILLLLALLLPVTLDWRPVLDIALVFAVFPLMVCFGATTDIPAAGRKLFSLAGLVSYPMYCLHIAVLQSRLVMTQRLDLAPAAAAIVAMGLTVTIAAAVAIAIEPPARRRLTQWLVPGQRR
jgi:peptidoglycan/LPS O-acetylase OafA/YrhL